MRGGTRAMMREKKMMSLRVASWQNTMANEPEGLLTVAFVNQIRPYNHLLGKAENAQTTALQSECGIVNVVRVQNQTFPLIYAKRKKLL